jgi:hypothetical protein
LKLVSEPVDYENTAIAVRKGSGKLLEDVNKIIEELQNNAL